jgi:hypothetical protein
MNRLLILSDRLVIRSDHEPPVSFRPCPAQTPPSAGARFAADRTPPARHIGRDLQALRTTELPLRRWAWAWPETVFVHQPARRTAAKRLRAQRHPCAGRSVDRRLPQAARHAQRDLCDQHRTSAATRGSELDRHGPGTRRLRLHQGGRHPRRHGCVLSCRRRPAVQSGGAR